MYKSIFLDYFKQINQVIFWLIIAQVLFSLVIWLVLGQTIKYRLFMITSLTISILQIGLSIGYLLHQNQLNKSLTSQTAYDEEWRIHEKLRIEKLIVGYRRTIAIWLTLIAILLFGMLTVNADRLRQVAFACILQLGFTLLVDIVGRAKTQHYYHLIQ